VTNTDRKIPFHLPVSNSLSLTGFVIVGQVKSVDFNARKAKLIESASDDLIEDVLGILDACIK